MASTAIPEDVAPSHDQRVFLREVPWPTFEAILAARGDAPVPRLAYLHGVLELMTPSDGHEYAKTNVGRLVEAYADETGIDLWGYGSWTLKNPARERGAEPDECYCLGAPHTRDVPDLAIEVAWTRGGLDKLEIYRGLGVAEVWRWEKGKIAVFVLRGEAYEGVERSVAFPGLDLDLVARLATHENPSQAVRELRAHVRQGRGSS